MHIIYTHAYTHIRTSNLTHRHIQTHRYTVTHMRLSLHTHGDTRTQETRTHRRNPPRPTPQDKLQVTADRLGHRIGRGEGGGTEIPLRKPKGVGEGGLTQPWPAPEDPPPRPPQRSSLGLLLILKAREAVARGIETPLAGTSDIECRLRRKGSANFKHLRPANDPQTEGLWDFQHDLSREEVEN